MRGHPLTKRFSLAEGSMRSHGVAAGSSRLRWETQIKNQANNNGGRSVLCCWESGEVLEQLLVVWGSPSFLKGYLLLLLENKVGREQVVECAVGSFSPRSCLWADSALSRTMRRPVWPQLHISRLAATEFGGCFLKTFWKEKGKRQSHAEPLKLSPTTTGICIRTKTGLRFRLWPSAEVSDTRGTATTVLHGAMRQLFSDLQCQILGSQRCFVTASKVGYVSAVVKESFALVW